MGPPWTARGANFYACTGSRSYFTLASQQAPSRAFARAARLVRFDRLVARVRYVGSMVSDVHRTILYGGIYIYPADKKSAKAPNQYKPTTATGEFDLSSSWSREPMGKKKRDHAAPPRTLDLAGASGGVQGPPRARLADRRVLPPLLPAGPVCGRACRTSRRRAAPGKRTRRLLDYAPVWRACGRRSCDSRRLTVKVVKARLVGG